MASWSRWSTMARRCTTSPATECLTKTSRRPLPDQFHDGCSQVIATEAGVGAHRNHLRLIESERPGYSGYPRAPRLGPELVHLRDGHQDGRFTFRQELQHVGIFVARVATRIEQQHQAAQVRARL